MKFPRMAQNSIFAILLRSPWWISFAIAGTLFAALRLAMPAVYAFFVALPFAAIGSFAAWRQLREPSASRVASALEELRAASWESFSETLVAAFRRDGYAVERLQRGADLELAKAGRITLVACRRWKAARTGIEPLRELHEARQAREAADAAYVAAGEFTANAVAFATEKGIRLIRDAELAKLVRPRG